MDSSIILSNRIDDLERKLDNQRKLLHDLIETLDEQTRGFEELIERSFAASILSTNDK